MASNQSVFYMSVIAIALLVMLLATDQIPIKNRPYMIMVITAIVLMNLMFFYRTRKSEGFEGTQEIIIFDSHPGFSQRTWTINTGDTVTWRNAGDLDHTVTSPDGTFNSGIMKRGDTYSVRFDKPGTYRYYCQEHSGWQKGVIIVKGSL